MPQFSSALPLPAKIMIYHSASELTNLCFATDYQPTNQDKYGTYNGGYHVQRHTMVVEVGAQIRDGITIAARAFGQTSKHDQPSMPATNQSTTEAIARIIDIGCQKIEKIVKKHRFIKEVIFMTSDEVIYNAIINLEEWLRNGVPATVTQLPVMELRFLHTNIMHLEAKNVQVLAWLVKPEYIIGPHCVINDFAESHGLAPPTQGCACFNCISSSQSREMTFARTGKEPCPCDPCRKIVAQYGHLKKGETFPLTNVAGVDAKLIMEEDGPAVKKTE